MGGRKISVMQLVYSLHMGGSEKVAFDICTHLNPDQFAPRMCGLDLEGSLTDELEKAGVPYDSLHRQGLERDVFRRLYRLVKEQRIDVVHTHHFTQLFFAALPARLAGARIVHTEHEYFSYSQSAMPRRLIRTLLRFCDAMTAVGPEVAEYFVKTAGIPRRLITIVPNGVDVTGFEFDRDTARRELGLNADEIVIGTVGRLEPEKDQITLLDAFRQLQMRHPRARLIIAGDGSMADQLKSHADRIGAAAAIRFLGYRRDIARLLAAMDVFLLTSIREGLPVSLIEAMAARRPVVASSIGSVRDLISDGKTGLLVAPGNVDGFRAAIERLIDDSSLRQNFVERARATIEASFSLPAVISAYETLYRSAKMNRHVRN